jgi:hypothetical protein
MVRANFTKGSSREREAAADRRNSPLSITEIPQVLKTRVGLSISLTYVSSGHLLTEKF